MKLPQTDSMIKSPTSAKHSYDPQQLVALRNILRPDDFERFMQTLQAKKTPEKRKQKTFFQNCMENTVSTSSVQEESRDKTI